MGIKRNFLFSSALTVSGYFFPIIVYPHVARSLGLENMGICNFVDSIIDYFIIFSMLGIAGVGVREIAESHTNAAELARRVKGILLIGCVTTIFAIASLLICTFTINALINYKPLLLIGIIKLAGNFLLLDWLYQGLEDFRYITIRSIMVKVLYTVAVFIFIWQPSDYITYYLLLCLSFGLNALLSCMRAVKIIDFKIKGLEWKRIFKPVAMLGLYMVLTSMYTTFNVAYLGFTCGDEQVGLYTTATKFFMVVIGFYTAFTRVMIPRMSSLYAEHNKYGFSNLMHKAIEALLTISVPLVIFCCIFSQEIINLFAGSAFIGATIPARIVFPLIFIIGYEQILALQILLPMKKDKALFTGSIVGAAVGLTANIILVNRYQAIGAAIAWLTAEIAVLISAQFFVSRYLQEGFPFKKLFTNLVAFLPMAGMLIAIWWFMPFPFWTRLIAGGFCTVIYSVAVQILYLRDEFAVTFIHKFLPFTH